MKRLLGGRAVVVLERGTGQEMHMNVSIFTLDGEEGSHAMHILSVNENAGVGLWLILQQNAGEEMNWTDTSLLYHLHLPFPSSVYFLQDICVFVCVWLNISREGFLWFS